MFRCRRYGGGLVLPSAATDINTNTKSSDSDGEGDSSANEYAEGLGCADRKRCREKVRSNFDFDNVPREEYFEEPRSYGRAVESDDEVVSSPACKRRTSDVRTSGSLANTFAHLERMESNTSNTLGNIEEERAILKKKQLAAIARRCEHRRSLRSRSAVPPSAASHASVTASGSAAPDETLSRQGTCRDNGHKTSLNDSKLGDSVTFADEAVVLKRCRDSLAQIRERFVAGKVCRDTDTRVLEMLRKLNHRVLNERLLKESGLGLELNKGAWKRHPDQRVAHASRALVSKWRAAVHWQRLELIGSGGA